MNSQISDYLSERKNFIDQEIEKYFSKSEFNLTYEGFHQLVESIKYSANRGGKRFRPIISLAIAESLGVSPVRILPVCLAVEFIHTYSLIHDDLPMMDNDDFRRGEPTNHKVFGEDIALLAGDALLTESFQVLCLGFADDSALALALVRLLSSAAGIHGMVGGQAIDIKSKLKLPSLDTLKLMHRMKTGALIACSAQASALACKLPENKVELFAKYGHELGFAFQVADDLLDSADQQIEKGSLPDLVGIKETRDLLQQSSERAKLILTQLGLEHGPLFDLIDYNLNRTK